MLRTVKLMFPLTQIKLNVTVRFNTNVDLKLFALMLILWNGNIDQLLNSYFSRGMSWFSSKLLQRYETLPLSQQTEGNPFLVKRRGNAILQASFAAVIHLLSISDFQFLSLFF